jgi:hypothetical protein
VTIGVPHEVTVLIKNLYMCNSQSREKIAPTTICNGLWWIWMRQELYVFNGTKHAIYVELGDSTPVCGMDIGTGSVFPVTPETRMVTLSYYTDTRDLMSVFVRDSGNWTTSLTPMVPPSCFTNDRQMGACIRRRKPSLNVPHCGF